jgi:hypothetical protein
MKLPYLVMWDNIPVSVSITEGLSEGGAPQEVANYTGKCNFREKTKTVRRPDGTLVQISGSLTVGCDIAPEVPAISGSVTVQGKTWMIASASRPRNPDGTVNHTKLELI